MVSEVEDADVVMLVGADFECQSLLDGSGKLLGSVKCSPNLATCGLVLVRGATEGRSCKMS